MKYFSNFGEIEMIKLLRKPRSNVSRRVAHVLFKDEVIANQLLQLPKSHKIDEAEVTLEPCLSKDYIKELNKEKLPKEGEISDRSTTLHNSFLTPQNISKKSLSKKSPPFNENMFNSGIEQNKSKTFLNFSGISDPIPRFKPNKDIRAFNSDKDYQEFLEFKKFKEELKQKNNVAPFYPNPNITNPNDYKQKNFEARRDPHMIDSSKIFNESFGRFRYNDRKISEEFPSYPYGINQPKRHIRTPLLPSNYYPYPKFNPPHNIEDQLINLSQYKKMTEISDSKRLHHRPAIRRPELIEQNFESQPAKKNYPKYQYPKKKDETFEKPLSFKEKQMDRSNYKKDNQSKK